MIKHLILISFVALTLLLGVCSAQTRSLNLNLDIGHVYDQDLRLEVSVRNHGFVVVPPTFTILRPILSSVSEELTIAAGDKTGAIRIENISRDAIDYSIQFRCVNCSSSVPLQYFTRTNGTSLGLIDAAYIDPDDFPSTVILSLQTLGFVAGKVSLKEGMLANKPIRLTAQLLEIEGDQEVSRVPVRIELGVNQAEYRFTGLRRESSLSYQVQMRCVNCSPSQQVSESELWSLDNHPNINFNVLERDINLVPTINLLLE